MRRYSVVEKMIIFWEWQIFRLLIDDFEKNWLSVWINEVNVNKIVLPILFVVYMGVLIVFISVEINYWLKFRR